MNYTEYKKKVSDDINNFPMMFAFSQSQFVEGLKTLGVTQPSELCSIGCNGFIRKADKDKYISLGKSHKELFREGLKDADFCYSMFLYEMSNTEYIYAYDDDDLLEACNLTVEELTQNDMLRTMFQKARKEYFDSQK